MKTKENKLHKCAAALVRQGHAVWKLLGKCVRRRPVGREVIRNDPPMVEPDPYMNPLDRIKEFLLHHALSHQVGVRFDDGAGDFVLEDADGLVHAKDYDKAVAVIQRTWLS